ncbi:hypothetical protein SAMN05421505_114120 [Sinosporangium album]|uniref:DUF6879 domain-containing protein n=1 Tax=Sinosporangium album TaxID=504805 RepID=A0A1G8BQ87_9ACTN|nr:DUF6879 family protein [Sinosporangium album]SDH35301.1 hypothetical protein SAMN05421505_114120 [Sinosporangium album]
MRDPNALALAPSSGQRLSVDDYRQDFRSLRTEIRDKDSWKFERRQHFEEDSASRNAFRQGRWREALALLEERREPLLQAVRRDKENNTAFHRVRVVEEPLSPYLQWELHSLRIQAECGKPVRVIQAEKLTTLEADGRLPEVVVLGGEVLYEVVYSGTGTTLGGIRFSDATLIATWEEFIKELYGGGEDVLSYFDRRVAHLPPPGRTG